MKDYVTDSQVEMEIERLLESPYVKLAKKEEAIRCRRRQYMYTLRTYEKKGKALAEQGVTMKSLLDLDESGEYDD